MSDYPPAYGGLLRASLPSFSAQLIACCGSAVSFATSYESPTGKNKSRSEISNSIVAGLICHHLSSWLIPVLSLQVLIRAILLGSPPLFFSLLDLAIHPSTHSSDKPLVNTHYDTDTGVFEDTEIRKVQPLFPSGSLSKGKERNIKFIHKQHHTRGREETH